MGLYDTFKGRYRCKTCGKTFDEDYQTKALSCSLDVWRIGDRVNMKENSPNFVGGCLIPQ